MHAVKTGQNLVMAMVTICQAIARGIDLFSKFNKVLRLTKYYYMIQF